MNDINRVKTNIPGFDNLINGGFPNKSQILISGKAGTGKTLFSLEFAYNSVVIDKQKVIYFSFEEKEDSLIEQALLFGWDLKPLIDEKKLLIVSLGYEGVDKQTVDRIFEIIDSTNTKRVVIDSLTNFVNLVDCQTVDSQLYFGNNTQKFLHQLISELRERELISFLIAQERNDEISTTCEYLCDGIIFFKFEHLGTKFDRSIEIPKLRKTMTKRGTYPFEIRTEGLKFYTWHEVNNLLVKNNFENESVNRKLNINGTKS